MVFGKIKRKRAKAAPSGEQVFHNTHVEDISDSEEAAPSNTGDNEHNTPQAPSNKPKVWESSLKLLLHEVTVVGDCKSNNAGGSKQWMCMHYKTSFKSSYTRIHYHFFGALDEKKAGIQMCKELMRDRALHDSIRANVMHFEKEGTSLSLKNSTLMKKHALAPSRPLQEAFSLTERETMDLKIIRGLCLARNHFNALRNPEFVDMLVAVNKAPKGYKPLSYEKPRTSLLDECKRNL